MKNIKNSLVHDLQDFAKLHDKFEKLKNEYKQKSEDIELRMKLAAENTLLEFSLEKNVDPYFSFMTESFDSKNECFIYNFEPNFSISKITEGNKTFVRVNNKWVHEKKISGRYKIYSHDIDFNVQPKYINLDHLNEACESIAKKTGCKVQIKQYEIVTADKIEKPKNLDDLLVIHTGSKILAHGEKYYEGWDIPDHWAIVETNNNELYVYYSRNGHGFGYDCKVGPKESLNEFYSFLGSDIYKIPNNIFSRLDMRNIL